SVLDTRGRVTVWSDELERILECPRQRAIGRPLATAVPALSQTQLAKAIQDAIANGTPQGTARLTLPLATRARALEIKMVPVAGRRRSAPWRQHRPPRAPPSPAARRRQLPAVPLSRRRRARRVAEAGQARRVAERGGRARRRAAAAATAHRRVPRSVDRAVQPCRLRRTAGPATR